MQTIHKYQLSVVESITIHTPAQIEPLCIALQNGIPCLWAKVAAQRKAGDKKSLLCRHR